MAQAAGQHKKVPDAVHVGDFFHRVENDADGVRRAARPQPDQAADRHVGQQRLQNQDAQPSHHDVQQHRRLLHPVEEDRLEAHAQNRDAPDDDQERQAPRALHAEQQKRCVGPGDEQKDGSVINELEDALNFRLLKAVVERRGQVQDDQRSAVDAETHHLRDVAVEHRQHHQHRQPGNAQSRADAVRDAVHNFFTNRVELGQGAIFQVFQLF